MNEKMNDYSQTITVDGVVAELCHVVTDEEWQEAVSVYSTDADRAAAALWFTGIQDAQNHGYTVEYAPDGSWLFYYAPEWDWYLEEEDTDAA